MVLLKRPARRLHSSQPSTHAFGANNCRAHAPQPHDPSLADLLQKKGKGLVVKLDGGRGHDLLHGIFRVFLTLLATTDVVGALCARLAA